MRLEFGLELQLGLGFESLKIPYFITLKQQWHHSNTASVKRGVVQFLKKFRTSSVIHLGPKPSIVKP